MPTGVVPQCQFCGQYYGHSAACPHTALDNTFGSFCLYGAEAALSARVDVMEKRLAAVERHLLGDGVAFNVEDKPEGDGDD